MKIVRIDGGLGNQMFCYAFAIALREASGDDVFIDSHRYKFFPNHCGFELRNLFNVEMREATNWQLWRVTNVAYNVFFNRVVEYLLPRRKTDIVENYTLVDPNIVLKQSDGYYIGNWQWYKYFDQYKDKVLKQLSFKDELDIRNLSLYNQLLVEENSVSLHIRRGDYLTDPKYCGICDLDYYSRAINIISRRIGHDAHFVIFSNDIEWCRTNILPVLSSTNVTFVDWNTGLDSNKDMRLMSACRVNIIANSSFSWWAAYMNLRKEKIVIAPKVWINLPMQYQIQCEEWECV